ncbi:farnesol dehydrogenase-like [Scaptodrosophila lebanonensis]|uniref:Farnesol dehydrogenase-like n=1 Tax=Drosophila lebanonensis TaxID=7225 RepID=A0A6J2TB54_DROLE|nr:farnesol dehydrogenase-like [Scaptodrosophila lebanonensis]
MERWQNRVAVVTGGSSGIGEAIVDELLQAGLVVVALARRVERLESHKRSLPEEQQKRLHTIGTDVSSKKSVDDAFDWVEEKLGGIDILVNNAGTMTLGNLVSMDIEKVQSTVQVNIMGVVYATQRAFKSMKERSFDGHVVTINSVLGHHIDNLPGVAPQFNIYPPTKYAVTAMSEIFRQEFEGLNTGIKMTSVSPGLTDTEIVPDVFKKRVKNILKPKDVADVVLFVISTPPHVLIPEVKVQPVRPL